MQQRLPQCDWNLITVPLETVGTAKGAASKAIKRASPTSNTIAPETVRQKQLFVRNFQWPQAGGQKLIQSQRRGHAAGVAGTTHESSNASLFIILKTVLQNVKNWSDEDRLKIYG